MKNASRTIISQIVDYLKGSNSKMNETKKRKKNTQYAIRTTTMTTTIPSNSQMQSSHTQTQMDGYNEKRQLLLLDCFY